MPRRIEVEITGDSRQLEQAFARSARSAERFNQDMAVTGAKAAAITFAFTQALEGAAAASKVFFGETSQVARGLGDASAGISSLTRLDPAGFFNATQAAAERSRKSIEDYTKGLKDVNQSAQALRVAQVAQAFGWDDLSDKLKDQVAALESARVATDAVNFSQRKFNATVIDGKNALVEYKGAVDDIGGLRGVGLAESIVPRPREIHKSLKGLSPSERRELELITATGPGKLPGLRDRLSQLEGADPRTHAGLVRNRQQIAQTEREIQGILEAQAAARDAASKAAEAEAKAEAKAAAERARRVRAAAVSRQLGVLEDPIPTPANLRRQLAGLQARRGELPRNIQDRLGAIGRLLGGGGKIYDETREAIRDYFRMVRGEFSKGEELLKPVATRGLNTGALVKGLGLSAVQNRRIQNRLAGFNVAGQALADVYLDGEKVGRVQKRQTQRDSVRSPKQKRGPNAGR